MDVARDSGGFTDFAGAGEFERLPNWKIATFATGALPQFEILAEFTQAYDAFLASTR
ncbi:MAG: hypothetical protein WA417_03920 [Stellaceae bacterium]